MTTKSYIAMCDNPDLQGMWKLKEGDYVYMAKGKDPAVELFSWADADAWETKELQKEHGAIWLPTQEQLWGMLPAHKGFRLLKALEGWRGSVFCKDTNSWQDWDSDSAEMVLLQMVMYIVFNKRWDGKWVGA